MNCSTSSSRILPPATYWIDAAPRAALSAGSSASVVQTLTRSAMRPSLRRWAQLTAVAENEQEPVVAELELRVVEGSGVGLAERAVLVPAGGADREQPRFAQSFVQGLGERSVSFALAPVFEEPVLVHDPGGRVDALG